jgi:hypothetical protein
VVPVPSLVVGCAELTAASATRLPLVAVVVGDDTGDEADDEEDVEVDDEEAGGCGDNGAP